MMNNDYRTYRDVPIPIPLNYGEGFEFELYGKEYRTQGDYNNEGKRKVHMNITSWCGTCAGAIHHYCNLSVRVNNKSKEDKSTVGGYVGGIKIPDEYTTLNIEIGRILQQDEIDSDPIRWEFYAAGDFTNAFESRDLLEETIQRVVGELFKDEGWVMVDV